MLLKDGKFFWFVDVYIYYNIELFLIMFVVDFLECFWVGGVFKYRYFNRIDVYVVCVKYKM